MDFCKIKKLIDLLEELNFVEIEIKEGEEFVCLLCVLVFGYGMVQVQLQMMMVFVQVLVQQVVLVMLMQLFIEVFIGGIVKLGNVLLDGYVLCVLMVGIFYVFLFLDKLVFVIVGQQVKVGEMLVIIEVMKMFNLIEVDVFGIIVVILGENGQLVEFDQLLFVIG